MTPFHAAAPLVAPPPAPALPAAANGDALARVATLAARALDAPLALLSPRDAAAVAAAAASGAWRRRRDAALERTLCGVVAATGRMLVAADAREHPRVRENPALWMGEVGYAGAPVRAPEGTVLGVLCVVDERRRAWSDEELALLGQLAALAAAELAAAGTRPSPPPAPERRRPRIPVRMLEKAVETMQLGVTITDPAGRIVYTNPAEARMHGWEVGELLGRHARVFAPPEHAKPMHAEEMGGVTSWSRETVNVRRDGTTFPVLLRSDVVVDPQGQALGIVTCCEDLTQRKEMERQLLRSSHLHPLTGLPNRGLLATRLELAAERARRGDGAFALLVVGIDRFKLVNDSLGHAAGDELLVAASRRLRGRMRTELMVAHLSGDEFAILLDEVGDVTDATRAARRVQNALAEPFSLERHEVFTTASVGITVSRGGDAQADDALRDATLAMYGARASGPGHLQLFDAEMHAQAMARLRMETELRRAVERHEFRVHYQPIVVLETGRLAGFEALIRWQHPERGLVAPAEFVPLAEETGLILPMGLWVLEEACRHLARLRARGADPALTVAVNLSARQFQQPDLVERVAAVLARTGTDPSALKLEITESVIMQHSDAVTETLHRLKALGLQLYVDDFGTGYSSLDYLRRLPVDALKIDRSFVMGPEAEGNLRLVRGIVALAHALDVAVVTEGIETAEMRDELRRLRCEYGQGYLFSRPLDEDATERLCLDGTAWPPEAAG